MEMRDGYGAPVEGLRVGYGVPVVVAPTDTGLLRVELSEKLGLGSWW